MNIRTLLGVVLTYFALFTLPLSTYAQGIPEAEASDEVKAGAKLFSSQCSSCHSKTLDKDMTGPALAGVIDRWSDEYQGKPGEEWLKTWIKNWNDAYDAGYPQAVAIEPWSETSVMNAFPNLEDEQVDQIVAFLEVGPILKPDAGPGPNEAKTDAISPLMLFVLIGTLILISLILYRVNVALKRLKLEKEGLPVPELVPIYKNKQLLGFIGIAAILFLGNMTVTNAINLGRQQGYTPDQPIKFSHELHAGTNQIDCQYCHTGASKGKHSNIPSANVCMNCHKAVQDPTGLVGEDYTEGRKEISKIYAAVGFNPLAGNAGEYFEDYENVPYDTVAAVFEKWLEEDPAMTHSESDIEEVLDQIQKPIQWVRIHNLPDHVYFNHSQHVVAGQVECQTCHGAVEEMKVLGQHAPLSMGWCISCHRETKVQFESNPYYSTVYQNYRDEETKPAKGVTVELIGGTECQKCHY